MNSSNEPNEIPDPVQDWENEKARYQALACKEVLQEHTEMVQSLRERQAAYLAALPTQPLDALRFINATLMDVRDTSSSSYSARVALTLIQELASRDAISDSMDMRNAVQWLSEKGLDGLAEMERAVERAKDTAAQAHPLHRRYEA